MTLNSNYGLWQSMSCFKFTSLFNVYDFERQLTFQQQGDAVCIKWVKPAHWPPARCISQLSTENVSFAQASTLLIAAEKTTDNKCDKSHRCSNECSAWELRWIFCDRASIREHWCLTSIFRKSAWSATENQRKSQLYTHDSEKAL